MLARELIDIPLKMLRADLVEGALVRPLQHRPEGFYAIRVRLIPDVLGDVVIDLLVVEAGCATGSIGNAMDRLHG